MALIENISLNTEKNMRCAKNVCFSIILATAISGMPT